jgi:hypothetical protein
MGGGAPSLRAKQPEREADHPAPASGARLSVCSAVSPPPHTSSFPDGHIYIDLILKQGDPAPLLTPN